MVQPWVTFGTAFQSPKAIHYIAIGIEFDERWRLLRNFPFLVCHVIAINDEDVVLCVHAYAADLSNCPFVRQRLWPVGIDGESRTVGLRLRATDDSHGDYQAYAKPSLSETPYLFLHLPPTTGRRRGEKNARQELLT